MQTLNITIFLMRPTTATGATGGTPMAESHGGGRIRKTGWHHVLDAALDGLEDATGDQAVTALRSGAAVWHQARSVRRRSAIGQNFASVPMRGFVVVPARIFQSVPNGTPDLLASCCSSAWLIARSRFFTDSSEGI